MKYKDATNKHSHLHREDKHITVEDLWKQWKTSEGKTVQCSGALACLLLPCLALAALLIAYNYREDHVSVRIFIFKKKTFLEAGCVVLHS